MQVLCVLCVCACVFLCTACAPPPTRANAQAQSHVPKLPSIAAKGAQTQHSLLAALAAKASAKSRAGSVHAPSKAGSVLGRPHGEEGGAHSGDDDDDDDDDGGWCGVEQETTRVLWL